MWQVRNKRDTNRREITINKKKTENNNVTTKKKKNNRDKPCATELIILSRVYDSLDHWSSSEVTWGETSLKYWAKPGFLNFYNNQKKGVWKILSAVFE